MDVFAIHAEIKRRLQEKRPDLLKAYEDAPKWAATGGEGADMRMGFFKDLKKNDFAGFEIIQDLVNEWIKIQRERGAIYNI